MTTITDERRTHGTPVSAPLKVLLKLTEPQVRRLEVLIAGFKPDRVTLHPDDWSSDGPNIQFGLWKFEGSGERMFFNGLIEPDGRAHT